MDIVQVGRFVRLDASDGVSEVDLKRHPSSAKAAKFAKTHRQDFRNRGMLEGYDSMRIPFTTIENLYDVRLGKG